MVIIMLYYIIRLLLCYTILYGYYTVIILISRYTQLSKFAMTTVHKISAARELIRRKKANNTLRNFRENFDILDINLICSF